MLIGTKSRMEINKQVVCQRYQQKASTIAIHQVCSLKAGESMGKNPLTGLADTADQMQPPSASLWHIQTRGNDESSHVLLERTWP